MPIAARRASSSRDRRRRVVRREEDGHAAAAELLDALGRAREGVARQPDHAVEVHDAGVRRVEAHAVGGTITTGQDAWWTT